MSATATAHSLDDGRSPPGILGGVAEKAGFRREGRLRQSWLCGDGVEHGELLWARLASDPDSAGRA